MIADEETVSRERAMRPGGTGPRAGRPPATGDSFSTLGERQESDHSADPTEIEF